MADANQTGNAISKQTHWTSRFKPALQKRWLLLIAGVMWSGVGILLSAMAINWLVHTLTLYSVLFGALGLGISVFANQAQFKKLAAKNIHRIQLLVDKPCVFSFQAWTGYLIIVIMMTTGILLRNSAIPKPYLSVVYIGIGGALLQASVTYYRQFIIGLRTPDIVVSE